MMVLMLRSVMRFAAIIRKGRCRIEGSSINRISNTSQFPGIKEININPGVIVFVGVVGAGKSTQKNLLASLLRSNGLKIKVSLVKTGHIMAYFLQKLLVKILGIERRDVYPIRALTESRPLIFRKLFKLWLILDVISVSIRFLLSVYLPMKMGRTVIVEEYIPASIADYVYLGKSINFPIKGMIFIINYMLKLFRICNLTSVIFLDACDFCLVDRWRKRKSVNELTDYLIMQRNLLLNLSKNLSSNFLYIDTTNKTIEEVHELIITHLRLISQSSI